TKGLKTDLRFYAWRKKPFMPVEFSGAAYRFGHSMIRSVYKLNDQLEDIPMFSPALTPNPLQHLGGFRPLPKKWTLDWSKFFVIGGSAPQSSRKIDTQFSPPMHKLPANIDTQRRSLALLNLLRGRALQLPSGQAVATAMGTARPNADLRLPDGDTPLYFYLLREAEVVAGGLRLGPTGGRIVAEVLLGLLKGDPSSFLRQAPKWKPELPSATAGEFTLPDLVKFAGMV
ncbi:MAG: peroxidase family protein, partial [Chloroflexota bacterium]